MAGLHDFTTKEVLNKVLLDSSGNAVAAYSHTTQEALNAVLDSANSRLNVKIEGGTISGDVTISGDLTVTGGGDFAYSEVITGDMRVQKAALSSADYDSNSIIIAENSDYAFFQTASATRGGIFFGDASSAYSGGVTYDHATSPEKLSFYSGAAIRMTIDASGGATFLGLIKATTSGIALYDGSTIQNEFRVNSGNTILKTSTSSSLQLGTADSTRMTIDANGRVIIGHTANVALGTTDPALQVLGTSEDASQISIGRFSADDTAPKINLIKGRGGIGANTKVADNDNLGTINFRGADGSDLDTIGASIEARVNGTPGANDLPAELLFSTTADNAATPTTRMTITSAGKVILNASPADYSAAPTLAFGDGDTGFYEHADDSLRIAISGQLRWIFAGTETTNSSNVRILTETSSATNPVFIANGTYDDGIGGAANTVALITNSIAKLIVDDNSRISLSNNDNNTSNTVFGKKAFVQGADGTTIIGDVGADYNVAIGEGAMGADRTSGNFQMNVGIGFGSLRNLTTGDYNVSIGHLSSGSLTTGEKNNVIGREAFATSQAGVSNVAIGHQTLAAANHTSNDGSIAIGDAALGAKNLASGDQFTGATVAIGHTALTALTSGLGNTAVGYKALFTEDDGDKNTAVGYEALMTCEGRSGDAMNTAVGYQAAKLITNSQGIVAIGHLALAGGDSYAGNVAIGNKSMSASQSGAYNVGVGEKSLLNVNVNGWRNTAVGHNAGDLTTSGTDNTFLGYEADADTATDSYQTAIGSYGIVKYITAVFEFTAGHATLHGAISMVSRIPARAIVTEAAVIVQDLSSNSTHNLELILSTDATKTVDSALTTSGITNPVLVGNSAAATYAQDSVTAMGTSNHIDAGTSSGVSGTVYYNKPTTTIGHASSDMYAWIANGDGSSNSDSSSSVKVRVKIGYIAL